MAALDLLGRRWSLRLLWELRTGPAGARTLLDGCEGLSSSVLYTRLRELTQAGVVRKNQEGAYELTPIGRSLGEAIAPLEQWSGRWARTTTGDA